MIPNIAELIARVMAEQESAYSRTKPTNRPTPQKRRRATAPGGWHSTKGPRVPRRVCNRREYKRRKKARKMQCRRNR
jgi:hypothetical protein